VASLSAMATPEGDTASVIPSPMRVTSKRT
jgi:hypothetical protein